MSNISALLREAAREVADEEKEDAEEMFQIAAVELANKSGGKESPRGPESPSKIYIKYSNYDVKEDVDTLLEQMSVKKPKPQYETMDDVDVLLSMAKEDIPIQRSVSPEPTPRRERDDSPPPAARRKSKPRTMTRSIASGPTFKSLDASEMSRVSIMLRDSDEKPWGEDIKTAFKSSQQELLFRSMKVVRPQSAQTKERLAREASLRMQKFRTSDLSIHAHRPGHNETLRKQKAHEHMRQSADRLCVSMSHHPSRVDLKVDPTLAYSTFDDAKECTFQPKINGKSKKKEKKEDDDGRVEDTKYSFINRQEAELRNRRDQLEFKMGQADYDALVDKKACPQCGAKQSYDEFKEKRKQCGNCRLEYVPAVSWGKVGRRFFRTNLEYSQKVAEKKQQLRQALENEFKCVTRTELDPVTGKTVTFKEYPKQTVLTPQEEQEFFDRVDKMMLRREESIKKLDEKIAQEKYPFKPTISSKSRKKSNESDEESSEDDEDGPNPVQAFLKRYIEDLEERRGKNPGKYIRPKARLSDEDLAPFRISKSIVRAPDEHM